MTMKRPMLMVFLLVSLLLVACEPRERTELSIREEVFLGTKGLEMIFTPGYPQTRIYDNQQVNVLVELRNKGISPIVGTLTLEGYDPQIVSFPSAVTRRRFGELKERTPYDPEGGFDIAEFSSSRITLPEGVDSYKPRFVVTACYPYKTIASEIVCVDPNPFSIGQEKACIVQSVSAGGGQGSPVTVDYIAVDSTQSKAYFRIKLGNKGGGKIISYDAVLSQKCPSDLTFEDLNKIRYRVLLGSYPATCSPDREVRFFNEQATISCTVDIPPGTGNAYRTSLTVEMDYGYKQSLSREVEILRAPR